MAILKGIGQPSKRLGSSKDILKYAGEKATLTKGLNCSSSWENAYQDFQNTKDFFNKHNGRQYLHYVQSFKEGEITPQDALDLTEKLCKKTMANNEVFLGVHTDTKHIHCHIVVNSVSFIDGYKFQCSAKELQNWKNIANEINLEHGLEIPQKATEKNKIISWKATQYHAIKKGIEKEKESDSLNLVKTIVNIAKISDSKETFIKNMDDKGYKTDWQDHKKHIVFTVKDNILIGKKNKFRLDTLGKTFNNQILSKEGLIDELGRNREQRLIRGEQTLKENTSRLPEYKQKTGFRTKIDDGSIRENRIITRKSIRESIGLRRVDTLDDKRRERKLQRVAGRNRKEAERREQEKQRKLNRSKSKELDLNFDIDF